MVEKGNLNDLEGLLLYKRIAEWDKDKLTLDDGTILTLEMTESDCCAWAGGTFSNVKLDAMITNLQIGESHNYHDGDTHVSELTITLFHNQNPIAQAEMYANAGNGGYYYSVGSFVVNDVHFPVVSA